MLSKTWQRAALWHCEQDEHKSNNKEGQGGVKQLRENEHTQYHIAQPSWYWVLAGYLAMLQVLVCPKIISILRSPLFVDMVANLDSPILSIVFREEKNWWEVTRLWDYNDANRCCLQDPVRKKVAYGMKRSSCWSLMVASFGCWANLLEVPKL